MSTLVIIVSHNSCPQLEHCLLHLSRQTVPAAEIIVVDSGSEKPSAIRDLVWRFGGTFISAPNIGFSAANNLGYENRRNEAKYTCFVNPDVFLRENFFAVAEHWMENGAAAPVGIISGPLLSFDWDRGCPSGKLDSTGIYRGLIRWHDRHHGLPSATLQKLPEQFSVPALCGALMFTRSSVLDALRDRDGFIFDPGYFLYKEDIDLSLRVRSLGYDLRMLKSLAAYHCRGWRGRRSVKRAQRVLAAQSDVRLAQKFSHSLLPFAYLKLVGVKWFDL